MLAQDGSEPAYLSAQCSTDVLRAVGYEILDRSHYLAQQYTALDQGAETRNLAGNCCPYLRLVVLQKLHKRRDEIPGHDLLVDSLCDLQTQSQQAVACHKQETLPILTFSNLSATI